VGRVGTPPEHLAVALPYFVTFDGPVGGIHSGAPVTLGGFSVGEVASVALVTHPSTGRIETRAVVLLDPTRLHIEGADHAGSWSTLMNTALTALVRNGLRAAITQTPPLIGDSQITLEMLPAVQPARLELTGRYPAIPTVESAGIAAIAAKVGRLPIDEIGENVRVLTAHIRALSSNPRLNDSLDHLDRTLALLDATVSEAGPQVAPTMHSLQETVDALRQSASEIDSVAASAQNLLSGTMAAPGSSMQQALEELTHTARSIRGLADYLDRHPDSLIRGRH